MMRTQIRNVGHGSRSPHHVKQSIQHVEKRSGQMSNRPSD